MKRILPAILAFVFLLWRLLAAIGKVVRGSIRLAWSRCVSVVAAIKATPSFSVVRWLTRSHGKLYARRILVGILILAALLSLVGSANASIALVASTSAGDASGTHVTTSAIDTSVTKAHKLIVACVSSTGGITPPTFSDSKSNTWTGLTQQNGANVRVRLYYCIDPTVGSGHTFSTSTVASSFPVISVAAFEADSPFQVGSESAGAIVTSGNTIQPGSLTPSQNGSLLLTGANHYTGSSISINSSYSKVSTDFASGMLAGSLGWLIQTTAAAVNPTWTTTASNDHGAVGVYFIENTPPDVGSTDQTSGRVFQRAKGTSAKSITFAGTYNTGLTTPSSIEVQIYEDGTSNVVQSWTAISSPTISGGNWSGTLSVPTHGTWLNSKARSKDGGGTVIATGTQTTNKWGVGILIGCIGQSNMANMFDVSSSPPTMNSLTRAHVSGSWGNVTGNGAIRFADKLQTGAGMPVGLLDYAVGGTTISQWTSTSGGTNFGTFLTNLTAVGGDCEFMLWHQGEYDMTGGTAKATYKSALDTIYSNSRTATGRSTSELFFGCALTGTIDDATSTDSSSDPIRQGQLEWAAATTGAIYAGSSVDMVRTDGFHWTAPYYERMGRRYAQAILKQLGLVSFGANGPQIASATYSGSTLTIAITQDGGSGLTELDGTTDGGSLTGFEVSNDAFSTTLTISSTAFSGNNVVLTMSAALTGTVVVRYQYGEKPSITNPVFDNTTPQGDTLGLPLQPKASFTATAAVGKTYLYYYKQSSLRRDHRKSILSPAFDPQFALAP